VILTTGTFLKGLSISAQELLGGAAGDFAAMGLSEHLAQLGFASTAENRYLPTLGQPQYRLLRLEVQPAMIRRRRSRQHGAD